MATDFGFEPTKNREYYFVSYNSEDYIHVGKIASELMSQGIPLWYDRGIYPDDIWAETIANKLRKCKKVILFVTRNLVNKALGKTTDSFVKKEYELAKRLKKKICFVYLDPITERERNDMFSGISEYKHCKFLDVHESANAKIIVDLIKRKLKIMSTKKMNHRRLVLTITSVVSLWIIVSFIPDYITLDYEIIDNDAVVTGYTVHQNPFGLLHNEPIYSLKIPDKMNGYQVTKIQDSALSGGIMFKEIVVSDNVVYVGDRAFSGCYNVKNIELPDSVTYLGSYAFEWCSSLESLRLPNQLETIKERTFYGCENLKDVVLPDRLQNLEEYSFYFSSIQKIVLPYGIKTISKNAFCNCDMNSIEIPNSVTRIEECAFSHCNRLSFIDLPDSITQVGANCFEQCTNLNSAKLSSNLKEISEEMFCLCYNLEQLEIPYGVTVINDRAFGHCERLKYIDMPNSVKYIGEGAFANTGAQHIEIPNSVTHIGAKAFYSFSLESVYIPDSVIEIGEGIVNQDFDTTIDVKIECSKHSYAYWYAKENKISVIIR